MGYWSNVTGLCLGGAPRQNRGAGAASCAHANWAHGKAHALHFSREGQVAGHPLSLNLVWARVVFLVEPISQAKIQIMGQLSEGNISYSKRGVPVREQQAIKRTPRLASMSAKVGRFSFLTWQFRRKEQRTGCPVLEAAEMPWGSLPSTAPLAGRGSSKERLVGNCTILEPPL